MRGAVAMAGASVALLAAACGGGGSAGAAKTVTVTTTVTSSVEAAPSVSETPSSSETVVTPKPGDFKIAVKVRKKECFGSAGCNVTYQIGPSYLGDQPLDESSTYDVTYEVRGGEDGPQINAFTITGGRASFEQEENLSTPSNSTKLKAKVTDVAVQ